MANPGFQTVDFGFQGVGEFGFQEEVITAPSVGGGASGVKRYRPPIWWEEGRRKKEEAQLRKEVLSVQKKIEETRKKIDVAPDLFRMERLVEQLMDLQQKLLFLLSQIDDLNKETEEEEVARIYAIYRSIH